MRAEEAARQAWRLLFAHKLRSLLTLFGLVWGTAAVILLMAWGRGVEDMLERAYFRTGKNLMQAFAGSIGEDFTPAVDRRELWLTMDDLERVRRLARLPELVGAERRSYMAVAYRQNARNVDVRGVEPVGIAIRGTAVEVGRPIGRSDLVQRRRVALLGHDARRDLLGVEGGVGSWIRLDGTPFQVVGVLGRVGQQFGGDGEEIDDQIWIPLTTFQTLWPAEWTQDAVLSTILLRLRDRRLLDETEREVRGLLAQGLGVSADDEEAILVWSPLRTLSELPLDDMAFVNLLIAAATLAIGGIGVLNMMLESVHERRREIGVRLAVGARHRDVVAQFFFETFALVGFGGAAGVVIGVLLTAVLGSLPAPDIVPVPVLRLDSVAVALAVMTAVGLGAGVIPAWRVSRVDPALTLRQE